MRKLTKLLSALIVLVLATAFIGCSNPSSSSDGTGGGNNTVTVIWNADVFDGGGYNTYVTKDGIALTTNDYMDFSSRTIQNGGTFTTSLGKFTRIEVTAANACNLSGTGWSDKKTWTGDASDSVSFSGYIYGDENFQITFTIEK